MPPADRRAVAVSPRGRGASAAAVILLLGVLGACSPGVRTPEPAHTSAVQVAGTPLPARGDRLDAVRRVVAQRLAAFSADDRDGWLAPLRGASLRLEQAAAFEKMRAMRVGRLRVRSVVETRPPQPRAGPGQAWRARVAFDYRVDSIDTAVRRFTLELSLAAAPGGDVTITGSRPADRPQPWDLPVLVARRDLAGLVLATDASLRDDVAARLAVAHRRVAAVWGSARATIVVAPATDADAARLLGRDPSTLAGIAAVTDGPVGSDGAAGADRIVIVPAAWHALSRAGREVVLAHELTHVTVRSSATRPMPLWFSEGFAEFVAYQSVDLPEGTIVAAARTQARTRGLPSDWPPAADFEPGSARLPAAYGLALLAARSIADRHGSTALVRLARALSGDRGVGVPDAVAGADPDTAAGLDQVMRAVLGNDAGSERRAWLDRIETLLDR